MCSSDLLTLAVTATLGTFNCGRALEKLVLHTSGRCRQEARRLARKQEDKNDISLQGIASSQQDVQASCIGLGGRCPKWRRACCGKMQCLGLVNWECGNNPGQADEYCNLMYPCDEHLVCHDGKCTEYKDVLNIGSKGTCKAGSPAGTIKVMSYNLFLINCIFRVIKNPLACQQDNEKKARVDKLQPWFSQSDADVVMFQEVWSYSDAVITAMTNAGFCHYVSAAYESNGSGMQIFSKYPLSAGDFIDYYDFTGDNSDSVLDPEIVWDKGVMYAKVTKDGKAYHVANTHTLSNSIKENHENRMFQYEKMRTFVESKNPGQNEMVFYGGDMNENMYNKNKDTDGNVIGDKYYKNMLEELQASDPGVQGDQKYSYDTLKNPIPRSFQSEDYEELLDYVLVSNKYGQPEKSSCEISMPVWPLNCGMDFDCQISDHFPVVCTYESSATTVTVE